MIYIHTRALARAPAYTHMCKHARIYTCYAEAPFFTNALEKMKKKLK